MDEKLGYMTDFFERLDNISQCPKAMQCFYDNCRKLNVCSQSLSGQKKPDERQFHLLSLAAQRAQTGQSYTA